MQISSGFISSYFSQISNALAPAIGSSSPFLAPVSLVIALIVFEIVLSVILSVFAYVFGWAERKIMARAHTRHGPTYVGKYGFLQNLADLIKLLSKENIMPDNADKPIFQSVIPIMLAIFVFMLALIPFSSTFIGIQTSLGLILVFMLLSLMPLLVFLSGWTSGNKFSSIAAQRSVIMLLSYEIPMVLVIVSIAMLASSYSFTSIVNSQNPWWFVVLMPIGFVVFFITMIAELERPPFDLREADSELIAGWLTDVSAPYYGIVLFLDYTRMFVGSLIIAVLFFGGWLGPSILPPIGWLLIKAVVIALSIIAVRVTTVRMRIDRLLGLGWKYLMPLSVVNLLITFLLFIR